MHNILKHENKNIQCLQLMMGSRTHLWRPWPAGWNDWPWNAVDGFWWWHSRKPTVAMGTEICPVVRWMDLLLVTSHSSWLNFHCQFGSLESESLASMVKEGLYPNHFFMAPSLAPSNYQSSLSNYQSSPSITIHHHPAVTPAVAGYFGPARVVFALLDGSDDGNISWDEFRELEKCPGTSWDGIMGRGMLGNPMT